MSDICFAIVILAEPSNEVNRGRTGSIRDLPIYSLANCQTHDKTKAKEATLEMRGNLSVISSALYVPANVEHRVEKALRSAAHAVILDLEDGVAEREKNAARSGAAQALRSASRPWVAVRVNSPRTDQGREDVEMATSLRADAIVLPKATPEAVDALGEDGPAVWALIETAAGLRSAYETAIRSRVEMLLLGTVDLALDLRLMPHRDQVELLQPRASVVIDSRAAGIGAPLDGVCTRTEDDDLLQRESLLARSLGFAGKMCIHPRQLPGIHAAFAPSPEDLDWARRVVEAYETASSEGVGAIAVAGELVDRPVVNQARRLLGAANEE